MVDLWWYSKKILYKTGAIKTNNIYGNFKVASPILQHNLCDFGIP